MIAFPNAKINIGLNITSKRKDGYHNLSSCFLPIGWSDALEIIASDEFTFTTSGLPIPTDRSANICIRAYDLLKTEFPLPPVNIHLHKVIPMGAGLGGGSADGAFTLKMLNELFSLNISNKSLEQFALQLGADCPFFIDNKAKLVSGIGEQMKEVALDFSGYSIVVVFPGIHVDTKQAFESIQPQQPEYQLHELLKKEPAEWQGVLINDFEEPIFDLNPIIKEIKETLLIEGAEYASMTGTGSAVYGFFPNPEVTSRLMSIFPNYLIWSHAM